MDWHREVGSRLARLDPVLNVGIARLTPVSHVLAASFLALLAWGAAERNEAQAAILGVSPGAAALTAFLLYGLLQAGRILHEAGHAVVGVCTGRRLLAVRLTPLLMVAEWPTDELWHAPSASRRLTAVAGSIVQVSFGIALLALSALFGENRAQVVCEAIFMCALLHICAIGNLLPVPRTDGHILFGRTPSVGPMWIAFASAVLLALPVPLLVTAIQFEHGFVRAYLASLQNGATLVPLVLALLALPAVSRRWLLPRA